MIPENRKAWVLTEPGRLELQRIPMPEIRDNQVLVEIDRACICNGSDPGIYHGHEAYQTPLVFGHEASGVIVKAGNLVTDFSVGDRVCWWFEAGAFTEYQAITPENIAIFKVPEGITRDEAPVMELVLAACRALMEVPPKLAGGRLLICGLGPSGLVLLQYAKALGYDRVIGWDLYESRRELAKKLGADEVYDPKELTKEAVEGMDSSDVGVLMMGNDCLPGEPTATLLMRALRSGGTVISYGHPEGGCRFSPYVFQSRNLNMRSPSSDWSVIRQRGQEIVKLVEQGKIRIKPLITDVVEMDDFLPAFIRVLERPWEQIKVILKVKGDT
ncbi:MAG: zinc-binding dehydrogenase [Lachnospiraceae bacterium]|nr:zinc-binding dehydrogenase [Lachnospiraceae bacterium]